MKNKEFVGFSFFQHGRMWIEAIPTHGISADVVMQNLPDSIDWFYLFAPSRNQARKQMFKQVIDPTGKGFNHFPLNERSLINV